MPTKPGRPAKTLTVSREARAQLESIARSQSLPAVLVRRAQMILRMADGESNSEVARRFKLSRPAVTLWWTRFRERGMAGLHNELKPGRPRSTSDQDVARLIKTALQTRPQGKTHWSRRGLADATQLSTTTLHRYLTLFGVQPHRTRGFKLSTDPFFIEKVATWSASTSTRPSMRWCCVSMRAPSAGLGTHAAGTADGAWLRRGHHPRLRPPRHHEPLFAALDIANGSVLTQCKAQHRHQEFLSFLRHIEPTCRLNSMCI